MARAPRSIFIAGAVVGAFFALLIAPAFRSLFHPPSGGIGAVTVAGYPKSFDYFVITLLSLFSAAGAAMAGIIYGGKRRPQVSAGELGVIAGRPRAALAVAALYAFTFLIYFTAHNHPYYELDFFHDGEHLSPAFELKEGARPYRDVFFLHGFAVDGGLDSFLLGDPPDPLRVRKAMAVLDAAAVALLALVASECVVSWGGLLASVVLSFCAIGAGQVDIFPYFRLAPILLAIWGVLRFSRTRQILFLFSALVFAALGILWSLEVGLYATGAVVAWIVVAGVILRRLELTRAQIGLLFGVAAFAPLLILLLTGSSIPQFLRDSLVIIPGAIDAVWSLPSPAIPSLLSLVNPLTLWTWLDSEAARYFLPPIFYGLLIAVAGRDFKRGDVASARRLLAIGTFSFVLLRTAIGRAGWSHTRFAAPFLGIAIVCCLFEPAWSRFQSAGRARWLWLCGFLLLLPPTWALLEVDKNYVGLRKSIAARAERLAPPAGSVPYSLPPARGLYTYPQNAYDLEALDQFVRREAAPGRSIFVFSGEKALYYLLRRHSATRVQDIPMLSSPKLQRQALKQLRRNPPALVVLHGIEGLDNFDGVSNRVRAAEIADWIDREYPRRVKVARFLIAMPR